MAASQVPVRVRFAPSPTGHLHLGGVRTALFNFLFARNRGGTFILRIEDTDRERSTRESVAGILESLRWLGLEWDEGPERGGEYGPYLQSESRTLYQKEVHKLLEAEQAYRCYCRPEELAARREEARTERRNLGYDGRCRELTNAERTRREREGVAPAVRVKVPQGETWWTDIIRGRVAFQNSELEDFVILKGDGFPTYNLAVVVDDARMRISHVIRGEDHVSNTPRQIVLYRALEIPPPQFAHVPMILGPDGGRLSKRHGAVAVSQYEKEGFLPEALVNYLALLGWSTPDSRQLFTLPELVREFDLHRVGKNAAIFDPDKLRWLNSHYLRSLTVAERTDHLLPFLERAGLTDPGRGRQWLEAVVEAIGERFKTLAEIGGPAEFFFRRVPWGEEERHILRKAEPLLPVLRRLEERLAALDPFDRGEIEKVLREEADTAGLKPGKIMQPLRVAVTGSRASPGLFESLELVGREETLQRIRAAWPDKSGGGSA